jgi:NAD-dependent SIR2 family protein deacetylase
MARLRVALGMILLAFAAGPRLAVSLPRARARAVIDGTRGLHSFVCARESGRSPTRMTLRGGGSSIAELLSCSTRAWGDSSLSGSAEGDDDSGDAVEMDVEDEGPSSTQSDSGLSSGDGRDVDSSSRDTSSMDGAGREGESEGGESEEMVPALPLGKVTTIAPCTGDLRRVVDMLGAARRVIVVTGAGISASCGIPTFRGHGQFYQSVAEEFGLADGHQVMDAQVFAHDPRPFFKVASRLLPTEPRPSPTHFFIRRLEEAGRLLRLYTQNIDTLERKAGIEKVVYCHGSFATATCTRCAQQIDGSNISEAISLGRVPLCQSPHTPPAPQRARDHETWSGKRELGRDDGMAGTDDDETLGAGDAATDSASLSWSRTSSHGWSSSHDSQEHGEEEDEGGDEEDEEEEQEDEGEGEDGEEKWARARGNEERETECYTRGAGSWEAPHGRAGVCGGVLKPDIVMFNERLPQTFHRAVTRDLESADLLLVMGTSLSVAPVAHIPLMLRHIPSILINAEPVMPHGVWDVIVHGACDDAIHALDRQGLSAILLENTGTIHEPRSQGSPRAPQPARAEAGAGHCGPEAAGGLQSSPHSPAQRQGQGNTRCSGGGLKVGVPSPAAHLDPERGEYVWISASQGGEEGPRKAGGGKGRQRQRERAREGGRRKHERKRGNEGGRSTEARADGTQGRDGGRESARGAAAWRHEKEGAISKVTVSAISKVTAKVTVSTRVLKQHSSSARGRERARERERLLASAAACTQEQAGTFPRHAFPPAISALQ